jgi:hypothetical protein
MTEKLAGILIILASLCFTRCKEDTPGNSGVKVEAGFQTSDSTIGLNQTISFTDKSIGSPTSWTWICEGGNPSISHEKNPEILYNTPGIYDVTLIVKNDISVDSLVKKDFIIVENITPVKFDLTWQKFPGSYNSEVINSFIKTSDGGYMSCGWIWITNGNTDVSIVKYDENLEIVWQKIFSGNKNDMAGSLIETSDGNYMVAGTTNSTDGDITGIHGNSDAFLLKMDGSGIILWQKSYGGSNDEYCENKSLVELSDHHFMISATSGSNDGDVSGNHGGFDLWLVNVNDEGTPEWEKCYGGSGDEYGRQIIDSDQGLLIGLKSNSNDGDFLKEGNIVTMISPDGEIKWKTNLGGINYGKAIPDNDGGFLCLIGNNTRFSDFEVTKLLDSGYIMWTSGFGGSKQEFGEDIIQLNDGSLIVLGMSGSTDGDIPGNYGNDYDVIISKLSASGKLLSIKNFGGSKREWANCILNEGNGEYLIEATTESDDFDVTDNVNGNDTWLFKVKESLINQ